MPSGTPPPARCRLRLTCGHSVLIRNEAEEKRAKRIVKNTGRLFCAGCGCERPVIAVEPTGEARREARRQGADYGPPRVLR